MRSLTPDALKDDPELQDSLHINENLPVLLTQKRQLSSLVSNSGKWLHIVKNNPRGSFTFFDNKIPRHLVSLDEKYLRRCLDLINISAFKSASCSLSMNLVGSKMTSSYHFDSSMIPKENVARRLVFDLPLVDDSGNVVISPVITGCKRVTHMIDKKPLDSDDDDDDDNGVLAQSYEKAVSISSTNSMSSSSSSSSEQSWSPSSSTVSQGTLQFTMKDNKTPCFVFSLDDQKEIYVATLSATSSLGFDRSSLDYSYLIHLKKGRGSELVGKIKVSTLLSVSSTGEKTVERQFVLFSNGGNPQLQDHNDVKKHRGLSKKVVDALKRGSRQRSISRFSRTSSVTDFCSWEPFQEHDHDLLEPVSLLDNEIPANFEASAVVVREQQHEEEKVGGWGMKFLKRTTKHGSENSKHSTSIDLVIPSGAHGGPRRSRNGGGPSGLVERWKSGGSCDCSGWDLGCPLTVLKGQSRKDQSESQCSLFELFTEGAKQQGIPGVRMMSVREGLYFVQFQAKISVLQCFSTALAYVHSQSQRLRPWLSWKCKRKL